MVLGCYYMTDFKAHGKSAYQEGNGHSMVGYYSSFADAQYAYDTGELDLRAPIRVKDAKTSGEFITTSVGRIIFNELLPVEVFDFDEADPTTSLSENVELRDNFGPEARVRFWNRVMERTEISRVVARCYQRLGNARTDESE